MWMRWSCQGLSRWLFFYLSSIYLSTHLSIYLSIYLSTRLSIYLLILIIMILLREEESWGKMMEKARPPAFHKHVIVSSSSDHVTVLCINLFVLALPKLSLLLHIVVIWYQVLGWSGRQGVLQLAIHQHLLPQQHDGQPSRAKSSQRSSCWPPHHEPHIPVILSLMGQTIYIVRSSIYMVTTSSS